jgi:hypothetical protein
VILKHNRVDPVIGNLDGDFPVGFEDMEPDWAEYLARG